MKYLIIFLVAVGLFLGFGYIKNIQFDKVADRISNPQDYSQNDVLSMGGSFTVGFEIYTPGVMRDFSDPKYHHQSEDVFISALDPRVVYVMKDDVTWDDFFKTLPFSLTKDCLVTGTKQTFCTNEKQQLRFYLNDVETPNALDETIREGDFLKVVYE